MPKLGLLVEVDQVFTHCSKAFLRAQLWDPDGYVDRGELPSSGEIHRSRDASFDADGVRRGAGRALRAPRRLLLAPVESGHPGLQRPRRGGGGLAARGVRRRAPGVRGAPPRRVDDATEGLRVELPGRRLPRHAGARRRARAPQVGDVVPRQSRAWPADGDRPGDPLRRGDGRARSRAGRSGGDRVAHCRGRRDRSRHPRATRRGDGCGHRLRRERRRDGAHARRAQSDAAGLGRRSGAPGARCRAPWRTRGRLPTTCARLGHRDHGDARQGGALSRPARCRTGSTSH